MLNYSNLFQDYCYLKWYYCIGFIMTVVSVRLCSLSLNSSEIPIMR